MILDSASHPHPHACRYADTQDEQFWADTCNQHYPSCGAFNCSGYLVKAVLIHSGTGMKRYDAGNVAPTILPTQELGEPPDYFQGFGRVLLANVLPLPDDPAFDLFVHDRLSLTSDQTVKFEVQIQDDSQPLRSWTTRCRWQSTY